MVLKVTKRRGDTASQDESGRVLKENYLILGEAGDGPLIAFGAVDPVTSLTVPSYAQIHTVDTTLKVSNLDVSRVADDDSPQFQMAVQWRSNVRNEQPNNTKWNKRVSSSGIEITERVNKDVDGNPIRNGLGDLYQADLEVVKYDEIINVAYNTKQLTGLAAMGAARGRVNSDSVTLTITRYGREYTQTFPIGTLKLGNATWEVDVGPDGDGFFNVVIPLIHRHQIDQDGNEIGWQYQIPNRGERYKVSSGAGAVVVKSNSGIVDLDADGFKLDAGALQNMITVEAIDSAAFAAFLSGL